MSVALVFTTQSVVKGPNGAMSGLGPEQLMKCTVDLGQVSTPAAAFEALEKRGFRLAGPASSTFAPFADNHKNTFVMTTYTFDSSTPTH